MPCLTSAAEEPAENNIPSFSIAVISSSYGFSAIPSPKGVFFFTFYLHISSHRAVITVQ